MSRENNVVVAKIMQERYQWKEEALRLREHLGNVCRALGTQCIDENVTIGFLGKCVEGVRLMRAENEALRKRLESATDFDFGTHTVYFNQRKKWMAYVGGRCVKCLLGIGPKEPTEVSTSCGFDTFEEADAAALKALEVAG